MWRKWREYARVQNMYPLFVWWNFRVLERQGLVSGITDFSSLPEICSYLFRCWKREVIVLDWPENSSSGLVSPYEIRKMK
jgi:hypothetical protein